MAIDGAKLRDALAPLRAPPSAATAERVFGGGAAGRSALAAAIAGTTDRKSKAYRSASRSLQRYAASEGKQRRTMGAAMAPRIAQAVQSKRAADKLAGPITVRFIAPTIKTSADARQRYDFDASLSAEDMEEVRQLLDEGDDDAAMEAFAAASLAAYWQGAAVADATIIDVERLIITRD